MRITKGSLRNRLITVHPSIRVASSRVRSSLFDIIGQEIQNKDVLDLFAGSGSLGIECLSLGANRVTFVDINKSVINVLKKNLAHLGITYKSEVIIKDAEKAIRDFYIKNRKFDFIFLDPPYYKGWIRNTLQTLKDYVIVSPLNFIICLGYYKDNFWEEDTYFIKEYVKRYGQTLLAIYRLKL